MTQWREMSEAQREAVRQASAQQSRRLAERDREFGLAMDVWRARDVYRVQRFFLGLAALMGLGVVIALCTVLSTGLKALFQ